MGTLGTRSSTIRWSEIRSVFDSARAAATRWNTTASGPTAATAAGSTIVTGSITELNTTMENTFRAISTASGTFYISSTSPGTSDTYASDAQTALTIANTRGSITVPSRGARIVPLTIPSDAISAATNACGFRSCWSFYTNGYVYGYYYGSYNGSYYPSNYTFCYGFAFGGRWVYHTGCGDYYSYCMRFGFYYSYYYNGYCYCYDSYFHFRAFNDYYLCRNTCYFDGFTCPSYVAKGATGFGPYACRVGFA